MFVNNNSITPAVRIGIVRRFIQILVLFGILSAVLLFSSGHTDWLWAWVFIGIYIGSTVFNSIALLKRRPEIIAERSMTQIEHGWEKLIGGLWALLYFLAVQLIAGLDMRYGWSADIPLNVHIVGVICFFTGTGLFSWALLENAFFTTASRIQKERGQTVCMSGPYQYIRHPGYLGAIIQSFAAPMLLGSFWALIPGFLSALLMIVRTKMEDKMLRQELIGYEAYAERTKYRVFPGIW
ncbi:isoprenylcysteine carboxylmethyltransferase family protein [Prosthecochloris sp.]|uniref:methyltransferase family protein n=1 Tax=Prosthecochloris sp. TaxID=290513 RepID=UPI0025F06885|nr:isoprenylcysteine carboxylmethyltransferase family protein [Prosthecochloris sp.]